MSVELIGKLPRYKEDDVAFVLERLPDVQPCTVPGFMKRALRLEARPGGTPSSVYARVLAAFRLASEQGKIVANGRLWRVAAERRTA